MSDPSTYSYHRERERRKAGGKRFRHFFNFYCINQHLKVQTAYTVDTVWRKKIAPQLNLTNYKLPTLDYGHILFGHTAAMNTTHGCNIKSSLKMTDCTRNSALVKTDFQNHIVSLSLHNFWSLPHPPHLLVVAKANSSYGCCIPIYFHL